MLTSNHQLPKSQDWFMEVMSGLGYGRCDLVMMPAFDEHKINNLHSESNYLYLISNGKLYYIDQRRQYCTTLKIDAATLQKLTDDLRSSKDNYKTLSQEQLNKISSDTGQKAALLTWGGLCHGVACMAMYASLLEEKEFEHFNLRFKLISLMLPQGGRNFNRESPETAKAISHFQKRFEEAKKNIIDAGKQIKDEKKSHQLTLPDDSIYHKIATAESLEKLESSLKDPAEKLALDREIFELRNFFDGVYTHQQSSSLHILFEEKRDFQNINAAIPVITPVKLENRQPVKIASFSCNHSQTELVKLFQLIREHMNGIPVSMIMGNTDHDINLSYHPNRDKPWILVNANRLPGIEFKDEKELAARFPPAILVAGDTKVDNCAFASMVFVTKDNEAKASMAFSRMMDTPEWKDLHKITEERAKLVDSKRNTWLHNAIAIEDDDTVNLLLKYGADVLAITDSENSPYELALNRSERLASIIWRKMCAEFVSMKSEKGTERDKIMDRLLIRIMDIDTSEVKSQKNTAETKEDFKEINELKDKRNEYNNGIHDLQDEIAKLMQIKQSCLLNLTNTQNISTINENEQKKKQDSSESNTKMLGMINELINSYLTLINLKMQNIDMINQSIDSKIKYIKIKSSVNLNKNKAKREISNELSLFKQLNVLSESITEKLREKKLDEREITTLMNQVYRAFPNKNEIADMLSWIAIKYNTIPEQQQNALHKSFHECLLKRGRNKEKVVNIMNFLIIFIDQLLALPQKRRIGIFSAKNLSLADKCATDLHNLNKLVLQTIDEKEIIDATQFEKKVFDIIMTYHGSLVDRKSVRYLAKLNDFFVERDCALPNVKLEMKLSFDSKNNTNKLFENFKKMLNKHEIKIPTQKPQNR